MTFASHDRDQLTFVFNKFAESLAKAAPNFTKLADVYASIVKTHSYAFTTIVPVHSGMQGGVLDPRTYGAT